MARTKRKKARYVHPIDPFEETYLECKGLIYWTVKKFRYRFGGNWDDMISVANEAFVDAYLEFTTEKGSFSSWICKWIWNYLRNDWKQKRMRDFKRKNGMHIRIEEIEARETRTLDLLLEKITGDARVVAELVIDTPKDLIFLIHLKGAAPRNYKSTIKEYLIEEQDWTPERVKQAYQQLGEMLQ